MVAFTMDCPRSRVSPLFVLLLLLLSVSSSHSAASVLEGTVVKIVDGDTSRKRLGELVTRKEVRVEFNKHDRYGRIVGKVLVTPPDCPTCGKTLDVGLAPVTTGMAWWYQKYAHEQSPEEQGHYEFAEPEAKAKRAGHGRIRTHSRCGSSGR